MVQYTIKRLTILLFMIVMSILITSSSVRSMGMGGIGAGMGAVSIGGMGLGNVGMGGGALGGAHLGAGFNFGMSSSPSLPAPAPDWNAWDSMIDMMYGADHNQYGIISLENMLQDITMDPQFSIISWDAMDTTTSVEIDSRMRETGIPDTPSAHNYQMEMNDSHVPFEKNPAPPDWFNPYWCYWIKPCKFYWCNTNWQNSYTLPQAPF
ncbi:MAG: hypothetical protein ACMUJM_07620 [bacterium]